MILSSEPSRTVETLVGLVHLERPYCYCPACRVDLSPLDEILGLSPGRTQLAVQKAAAKLVMLPPGRARLTTNPSATGSPAPTITIGTVRVACWAARITTGA